MNDLNSVLIEGRLTRDPELRYTTKGTAVVTLSLATNRYYKQEEEHKEEVSYFEVVAYAKLAEVCNEYLKKARGIRVVGRLRQDRWTTENGDNRSKVTVVAEHVEFKPDRTPKEGEPRAVSAEPGKSDDIGF